MAYSKGARGSRSPRTIGNFIKKEQGVSAKAKINAAGRKAGKTGSSASNKARWDAAREYRRRGL